MSTTSGLYNPTFATGAVEENVSIVDDAEYDDVEEEEEIVEEVSEDEVEEEGDVSETASSAIRVESPAKAKKPAAASLQPGPGKVVPSDVVKKAPMGFPPSSSKSPSGLPKGKNPFTSFGNWNPEALKEIEIMFPSLDGDCESTNDLTRAGKPDYRYWKKNVVFKYGQYTSESMRINDVHVPCMEGRAYGLDYIYMCFPGFFETEFGKAGRQVAPTKTGENSLVPDGMRWWKAANKIEEAFGYIKDKKFHSLSLPALFNTNKGFTCAVDVAFVCKANTKDQATLRPTTPRTIAVEVRRAYITKVNVDVQRPVKVSRKKVVAEPIATAADVASDSLLNDLASMGIL